jgi:hypothetical protein
LNTTTIGAVWTVIAATIALAGPAHADTHDEFASPGADIGCDLYAGSDGQGLAQCAVHGHSWVIAAPVPNCDWDSGDWEFVLSQGNQPTLPFSCAADTLHHLGLATLNYGQTRSAGAITCDSQPSGVRCTDSSSGHFFRVSRESYELG